MNERPEEPEILRIPPWMQKRKKAIRAVGIFFSVSSVGFVLFALTMIIRNERAHNEATCPFRTLETRELSPNVRVRDEARECVDGLSEHRWAVSRDGGAYFEIGRRRLSASAYAQERYTWTPSLEGRNVRVHVVNEGIMPITYREEVAHGVAPRQPR